MRAAGGNTGGALCKRSITDFATSAAVRIGSMPGRLDFGAARDLRTGLALRIGAALGSGDFATRTDFVLPAGGVLDLGGALRRISSFLRACFAAFFAALKCLRAVLSAAFAARTLSF